MTWTVTIHHIDVGTIGDSTIIRVQHPGGGGVVATDRTVLIDGGLTASAARVHAYLGGMGVAAVHAIAVTHYDRDHYYGIRALLHMGGTARYSTAKLYDPGRLPVAREFRPNGTPSMYANYRDDAAAKALANPAFRHVTREVNSFRPITYGVGGVAVAPGVVVGPGGGNYHPPNILVGRDILWGNGDLTAWAEAVPAGAPRLRCITANKYVEQVGGLTRFCSTAAATAGLPQATTDLRENANSNAKSLGFLLTFNNFKYYVAGDLETAQEDGAPNLNVLGALPEPGAMFLLNQPDTMAGRVLAMKTSHHGSRSASTRTFINRLRPSAAIISTGSGNQYEHPAQPVVNILDGYVTDPVLGDLNTRMRHPPTPPPAPQRAVPNYITGYQQPLVLLRLGGDASQTAGDPGAVPPDLGHIRITVTEAQSQRPAAGQTWRGTREAAQRTDAAFGGVLLAPAQLDQIAEASAAKGPVHAVALAVGAPIAAADTALEAVAWMGDNEVVGLLRVGLAKTAVVPANIAGGVAGVRNAMLAPGFYGRAGNLRAGTVAAVAAAVTAVVPPAAAPGLAAVVFNAATNPAGLAGPPAAAPAAQAAAAAAFVAYDITRDREDTAYAIAAALGAMATPLVTPAQAAAIGAACTALVSVTTVANTARIVTRSGLNAALGAPLTAQAAARAGAVAASSYYLGVPDDVRRGTVTALTLAGIAPAVATPIGLNAQAAATLVGGQNSLFNVSYISVNGNENVPHAD